MAKEKWTLKFRGSPGGVTLVAARPPKSRRYVERAEIPGYVLAQEPHIAPRAAHLMSYSGDDTQLMDVVIEPAHSPNSKRERREQSYGSFIVTLWSGQTARFHDMPKAQEWAASRLQGQEAGAYAAFYRAPVAPGRQDTGAPWTEPFHVLIVNEYGRIVVADRDNWPNIPPRPEMFPYRGSATPNASVTEAQITEMLSAYVEAALWSTNDESDESGGEPLDANYSVDDIADEALASMRADVVAFAEKMSDVIEGAAARGAHSNWVKAGHDFWLTRNGHGAGFWDGDWQPEEDAEALTAEAESFGGTNLYVGDDGKIYEG